ncbi:MAG: AsmA family protein [Brevundimonas sp.]|uniref:AsmA family protein n=1 Tax=Brevundimonas sp. TaxID=1871086 RepID=UPI0025BEC6D7|nr:AsmA family protein [Brevundimonas sp.]MBX3478015.1 AsmA family protein [Brevundimonas sp.]
MARTLKDRLNWRAFHEKALVPAGAWARSGRDWVRESDPVYTSFRRPGPPEKWAAGLALGLIAALVVFLLLFDWNWLRGPIGRWASAKYDREVAINGDLDVRLFSWTPSVVVHDLKFGGPAWARERDTADVGRIEASVRLRKLFAGQVEMPLLSITRPTVVLIATQDGRRSWDLNPGKPDTGQGMKLPPINQLIITDGRLSLDEQRRGLTLEASVTAREARSADDGESGFRLSGTGTLNRTPLRVEIRGGPFINIRRDRPYGFHAELDGARSRLRADGSITRPFDLGRFTSTLSLSGQDLADLYLITGVTTPNTPPYQLSGTLSRSGSLFRFDDFSGRVGSSDLSGDVRVNKVRGRRWVEATLASRALDIDDLMAVLGTAPKVTPAGTVSTSGAPGRLLPDAPLNVERLRVMDGRVRYRAASVKRNDLEIRRVDLGAELQSGVLNLDPVAFAFNRGELHGVARIDARRDTPYSSLDFRLSGYPLESVIPARDGASTVTGRALGRAKLEGAGASVHAFADNAKGSLSLVVPQGQMRAAFAELLGINVGAGLRKLLSHDTSASAIRCAVADFTVNGGVARARTFVIDTDVVLAQGSGEIDLGAETLNLKIDGESKKPRLLRVWAPILVRGSLTSPSIGVEVGAVAAQGGLAALIGAVAAPLAALFAFVEPGLAEDADCGRLIASAR